MKTTQVAVRLDSDLLRRLDSFGRRTGMNRSQVIERMLELGMAQGESLVAKLDNPMVRGLVWLVLGLDPSISEKEAGEVRQALENIGSTRSERTSGRRVASLGA